MSLADDFSMYYGGTFIGCSQNQEIKPFYVDRVFFPSRCPYRNSYGEDGYNSLLFAGMLYDSNGEESSGEITLEVPSLVFNFPDPSYIKLQRVYSWFSYRANRSTKKGLCERRVYMSTFNPRVVYSILNKTQDDNIIDNVFLKKNGYLFYKGREAGEFLNDTNVVLKEEAFFLRNRLERNGISVTPF